MDEQERFHILNRLRPQAEVEHQSNQEKAKHVQVARREAFDHGRAVGQKWAHDLANYKQLRSGSELYVGPNQLSLRSLAQELNYRHQTAKDDVSVSLTAFLPRRLGQPEVREKPKLFWESLDESIDVIQNYNQISGTQEAFLEGFTESVQSVWSEVKDQL